MKTNPVLMLLPALLLTGCTPTEPTATKVTPSASAPLPSLGVVTDTPPPPGPAPNGIAAAQPAPAEDSVPTFSGTSEAERLTWALRAYYDNPNRPAVSSFEPLVAVKLLKTVPVAPPGKKYVIDMKLCEVRLENR